MAQRGGGDLIAFEGQSGLRHELGSTQQLHSTAGSVERYQYDLKKASLRNEWLLDSRYKYAIIIVTVFAGKYTAAHSEN